jgi:hypothetical protein
VAHLDRPGADLLLALGDPTIPGIAHVPEEDRQRALVIQIVGAPNLTPNICVEVIRERTAGARTEHRVMGGWPGL